MEIIISGSRLIFANNKERGKNIKGYWNGSLLKKKINKKKYQYNFKYSIVMLCFCQKCHERYSTLKS